MKGSAHMKGMTFSSCIIHNSYIERICPGKCTKLNIVIMAGYKLAGKLSGPHSIVPSAGFQDVGSATSFLSRQKANRHIFQNTFRDDNRRSTLWYRNSLVFSPVSAYLIRSKISNRNSFTQCYLRLSNYHSIDIVFGVGFDVKGRRFSFISVVIIKPPSLVSMASTITFVWGGIINDMLIVAIAQ